MAGIHDLGYKYLFAHAELVRELLADFTEFDFLGALDLSAFERVNPSYVSDRFSERHDDILWRARVGDQWFYIYILLEFQSGIDRWMALRMQVYIGLSVRWTQNAVCLRCSFAWNFRMCRMSYWISCRCFEHGCVKMPRRRCGVRS